MTTNAGPPRRELRIALALNGGVSLAIWIGGVVDELVRLVTAGYVADRLDELLAEKLLAEPEFQTTGRTVADLVQHVTVGPTLDEQQAFLLETTNPYVEICWQLGLRPVVDVITGTERGRPERHLPRPRPGSPAREPLCPPAALDRLGVVLGAAQAAERRSHPIPDGR